MTIKSSSLDLPALARIGAEQVIKDMLDEWPELRGLIGGSTKPVKDTVEAIVVSRPRDTLTRAAKVHWTQRPENKERVRKMARRSAKTRKANK